MRLLSFIIAGYILGLLTFYIFATFDTLAWDISYFGWAKVFDCGLLMWGFLYHSGSQPIRKLVKWLYFFAYVRFAADIYSFFTGDNVNNDRAIAILFLCLIFTASVLLLRDNGKPSSWLSKHLKV